MGFLGGSHGPGARGPIIYYGLMGGALVVRWGCPWGLMRGHPWDSPCDPITTQHEGAGAPE